jgi:transketolase
VDTPIDVLSAQAREIRRIVLEQSRRANVGHIGSALCVADLLAALYGHVLRAESPDDPDRDRFVLSKGHAALALYAALRLKGWIKPAELNTYCGDGSLLGVHPERALSGVDFSTGSLGHGLSMGVGAALAARLQGSARRVFVLVSDAECNEGALWEAAMFAAHHRLANLTAIVDVNGQQALGRTEEILSLEPLRERWSVFGWDAVEVDGHDTRAIVDALGAAPMTVGPPRVVLARTVFGRGVSFMESQLRWHYWPMSEDEYRVALAELEHAA